MPQLQRKKPPAAVTVGARHKVAATWTTARQLRAVQLYLEEGLTASEVAETLGGLTRCAVIAKIRRLGFSKRELAATFAASRQRPAPERRPRVERRLPPQPPPKPLPPLRQVPPTGRPVPLSLLPDCACRWPIDDPGPGRMHLALFCAGPTAFGAYCAAHRALAARQPLAAP